MTRPEILAKLVECRKALEDEGKRLHAVAVDMPDVGPAWEATHNLSLAMWDVWEYVESAEEMMREAEKATEVVH